MSEPTTRSYTLFWSVLGRPPGGIPVTAEIPASWQETIDGMGSPTFEVPHLGGVLPTIVAIHAPGASEAERLDWALQKQFGDALPAVTRTPRDDGRLWAVHRRGPGHVHARMFLPAPHDSVVMAVTLILGGQAGWLEEIEPVFETVRVADAA
jgi:hypothetical protein